MRSLLTINIWQIDVLKIAPSCVVYTQPIMEVGMLSSPIKIAADVSLKIIIQGPNLYWNSCLKFTDDKYAIAF